MNQKNSIKIYNESSLTNSMLKSMVNNKPKPGKNGIKGLSPSDLEVKTESRRVSKDDNDLLHSQSHQVSTDSMVRWLQAQRQQQGKLIQHLAAE